MRKIAICLSVLLLFGLAKLPFERGLLRDLHTAHFLEYTLNLDVREQAGQMGFVAAFSGYRAVVADYLWIKAYTVWTRREWGRLKFLLDASTSLQPRAATFWDQAAWHMAWNASVAARENGDQPREALRIKAEREYIRLGEQYLLDGIKYNPDRAMLFETLGRLYKQKLNDHCGAAQAYAEAAKRKDALPYLRRLAIYELSECPGHEQEAYEKLLALYHESKNERLPTLLKRLKQLQEQLQIPPEQQIDITEDLKEALPH